MKKHLFFFIILAILGLSVNAQWQKVTGSIQPTNCLAVKGDTVFAGTSTAFGNGVNLCTYNGFTWVSSNPGNTGLTGNGVTALAVIDSNIFAGTFLYSIGGVSGGVYLSTNDCSTWVDKNYGMPMTTSFHYYNINALAVTGNNVFAGTSGSNSDGVCWSPNNGSNWTVASNGLDMPTVYALGINGNTILAGGWGGISGIYKSLNLGGNWAATSCPNTAVNAIAINGNNIVAGTQSDGIYLSSDNGSTWGTANTGLTYSNGITSVAINGSDIFAGTTYYGVFSSLNNGSNWTSSNFGLTDSTITSLAICGNYIFAGTGTGVWVRVLSQITGIKELNENKNIKIYPNPVTNNFSIESQDNSIIKIITIQGQLLKTIEANNRNTTIDVSDLSGGVYFITVTTDNGTTTKKFIKE